jgi:phosphonate transport system substrate-binding protein
LTLGAVAYDAKVVTIWNGFQEYFRRHGLDFDYVLYSSYEKQVEAHVSGQIHVAWNSPLAWLQSERVANRLGRRAEAVCMRDTDRDLTSIILVRSNSEIHHLSDLTGRRIAVDRVLRPARGQARRPHRRRAGRCPRPRARRG